MYLKRIDVKGFKSFADRIGLELDTGITAVVGPNGSGKSNISDAVRWVLGEQSARNLRGVKMEDVIFAGTNVRKPLGFAEVTITIDNSDNMLPIEYSEATITRRMYRSGESEYFINKTNCRLRDITELFMDTGVGRDGYSIIGQGRIDEILNTRAEDRREFFEEAAGIVKYKSRKLEAEKKLDNTEQNIIRIRDIINELEGQLEPLREQSEKARKFLDLREKLKQMDINIFIRNMEKLKERVTNIADSASQFEDELVENNRKNARLEEEYEQFRISLSSLDSMIESLQNELYKANNDTERLQGEINVLGEKKSNITNNVSRLEDEIRKENGEIEAFSKTLEEISANLDEIMTMLAESQRQLDEKDAAFVELNSTISEKEDLIEGMKSETIEILNKMSEKRSSINSCNVFKSSIEKRKQQIDTERSGKVFRREELDVKLTELGEEKDTYNRNLENIEKQMSQLNLDKEKAIERKKHSDRTILDLKEKIQSKKARYRVLCEMENEFEGFNRSVKEVLKLKGTGKPLSSKICGVVADLIHVPIKYEIAIEAALGSALQNIVTDDEYAAKECIEYLKINKYGRATFLPLTTVNTKNSAAPDVLKKKSGFIGLAGELVSYDNKYSGIISSLLGRVIVVENMDDGIEAARGISYSMKIVTLEGDIISPGGAFTGGSLSQKTGRILSRKREIEELENEMRDLENSLSEADRNKVSIENEIIRLENNIKTQTEKRHEIQVLLSSCSSSLDMLRSEMGRIGGDLSNLDSELIQLENDAVDAEKKMKEDMEGLKELESKSVLLSDNVQDEQSGIKDILSYREELMSEMTSLKVKIAEYRQGTGTLNEKITVIELDVKNCTESARIKEDEINSQKIQLEGITDSINQLELSITEILKKKDEITNQLEVKNNNKRENTVHLGKMEELIKSYTATANTLQNELHKLEVQKARLDMEMENLQNRMWEDYEINYASAQKYRMQIDNLSQVTREIASIKDEIKELGDINVASIDEYKRVKERYEFLTKQGSDLEEAKNSLQKVIDEMTEKMQALFVKNFAIINENFNVTFQQLFGGGRAQLLLCNEENVLESGIEIVAEPPGKKLQSLTLLSGGEKALTAIALLFGILKMKPSPFCILDEIEAALDDLNVVRYAKFLKELSKETQFIIVTHRKGTMEIADALYGVTMEEKGVSRLVSVKLTERAG